MTSDSRRDVDGATSSRRRCSNHARPRAAVEDNERARYAENVTGPSAVCPRNDVVYRERLVRRQAAQRATIGRRIDPLNATTAPHHTASAS